MNMGRNELLQWVNGAVQAQYPSIEALGDGIAYCQIFEAVHPGSVNVSRLSLRTRLPLDRLRNLRLLEDAFKNLRLSLTVSIQKMADGRFQDNLLFTQWLFAHANKYGQDLPQYSGYQRRIDILHKQGKSPDDLNQHLVPNQAYFEQEGEPEGGQLGDKAEQISQYISSLQGQLKEKMELNWRMMHLVGRSIEERNSLYGLLQQIEKAALNSPDNPVRRELLKILYEVPPDFK